MSRWDKDELEDWYQELSRGNGDRLGAHGQLALVEHALDLTEKLEQGSEKEPAMIEVGTKLYGFCEGNFGRDSYDDKTVEGVGKDWVVARQTDGVVVIAHFQGQADRDEAMRRFRSKPQEDGGYDG